MTLQSTVAAAQGFGVVGEVIFEGPLRATPGVIKHSTAADIVVGRAFTIDTSDGTYRPGGTGPFGGILSNPKALASVGTLAGGPLAPTLVVPTGTVGEFTTVGIMTVLPTNAATIGDEVVYDNTTGELTALAKSTFTGVIAVTTGVLTVSAASAAASIGVGSVITGTGVPAGTYVTARLTGTGGNGTYQTNIITAVASFTDGVATSVAPSGKTKIPGALVTRYNNAAAALTVVSLNQ